MYSTQPGRQRENLQSVEFAAMRRREFLFLLGAAMTTPRMTFANEIAGAVKIVRVIAFDLKCPRVKFVGKNSRLDVHGDHSMDRLVKLVASNGIEGFGCCRAKEEKLAGLLGKSPSDALKDQALGVHSMPLLDLVGKMTGKPVYELLAREPQAAAGVRVYDGSIYFQDLLPQFEHSWRDQFKKELDDLVARGHRAFKVKIGRGAKWMPREEGDRRDVEVLKVLREHAGKDVAIAVDANNGYGLERTMWLLNELPDYNFDFIEEMFPEAVDEDLALKQFIREKKLKTLVADGETNATVEPLKPFMPAKAIDLYQLDVNAVGCEGLIEEAKLCAPHGEFIAPHTWGTLLGFYAQLHVARAIPNFYSGEQDPLSHPAIITDAYQIKDGLATVPDSPGFGLKLDESNLKGVKVILDKSA
jgi:L-alanine-DL-glutamate epimerase-like enolase superfamily enzyme